MTTPPPTDGLSPLEKALVDTLSNMHRDVIKELRTFRWQTLALVVFLVGIVALLKGVDPRIAASIPAEVLGPASPVVPVEVAPPPVEEPAPVEASAPVPPLP